MPEYYYKEIIRTYQISEGFFQVCLQNQWVEPMDKTGEKFAQEDLARLLLIRDLMEDMGVNDEAVPIILSLVDQINVLQNKARWLGGKVKEQPSL